MKCRDFLITLGSVIFSTAAFSISAAWAGLKENGTSTNPYVPFRPPVRAPHYTFADERGCYRLIWRPRTPLPGPDWEGMHMRVHRGFDAPLGGPWLYNWAIRRDPCVLVSGDLPRPALLRIHRGSVVAPPFHKLGDLRVRVHYGDKTSWLDEESNSDTVFHPWGTVHEVDLRPVRPVAFILETFLNENRALAAQLTVETESAADGLKVDLCFGGMDKKGAEFIPPYILPSVKESLNDQVTLVSDGAVITDSTMPDQVRVTVSPVGELSVSPVDGTEQGGRLVNRHILRPGRHSIRLLAQAVDSKLGPVLTLESYEAGRQAAKTRYNNMLVPFELKTPDRFLNAAFDAALLTLEYLWQAPAWLEGLHEWPSYYCNNYQISSAVALGQFDRARDALLLFGTQPDGPSPVLNADGSPNDADTESGLPYFILQLWRYWQASGDQATLERLWQSTCKNLGKLLRRRDPDGNGLLGWRQGCNSFLYQADHLAQPGDAPSPTLMLARNLEQMAELAEARGETAQATRWRERAAFMKSETLRQLWRPSEGRLAAVDAQGLVQQANYYTDFVFPVLHGKVPVEYQWVLLRTLDRTLWVGDHLMRSGNFIPSLFGNDIIAPVQMCESAEAYFELGRANRGWALLHGTAQAATIYTDSPGSFPEFMTESGWGQADYLFGNPAAAYVHAVAEGLFGFARRAAPLPLSWHPGIPEEWQHAYLKLGDVQMSITGAADNRQYQLTLPVPRAVSLRLPLWGRRVRSITDVAGHPLAYKIQPNPGGGFLHSALPAATRHVIHLETVPAGLIKLRTPQNKSRSVRWSLPASGIAVTDPQGVFSAFRVQGNMLRGTLSRSTGPRTFFLRDASQERIIPVDLDFSSTSIQPPRKGGLVLTGKREPIDLSSRFNTVSFRGRNAWRFGEHRVDVTDICRQDGGRYWLNVGRYTFQVLPKGRNILGLEVGSLDPQTTALNLASRPKSVRFTIKRPIRGIELLLASEVATRLSRMTVGELVMEYADGWQSREPLVYGRNIDGFIASCANEVELRELGPTRHVAGFAVPSDEARLLESVELRVTTPDAFLGLLAANLVLPEDKTKR